IKGNVDEDIKRKILIHCSESVPKEIPFHQTCFVVEPFISLIRRFFTSSTGGQTHK
ncbi:14213_t:CDS:1, partial [Funneliformis mosseae]